MIKVRESYPLWVWVTLGLLVFGSLAYVGMAFLVDQAMDAMK